MRLLICVCLASQNLKKSCLLLVGVRPKKFRFLCAHGEQSNAAERPAEIPFFNGMTGLMCGVWYISPENLQKPPCFTQKIEKMADFCGFAAVLVSKKDDFLPQPVQK